MMGYSWVVVGVILVVSGLASAVDVECPDPGLPNQGQREGPSRFTPGDKVSYDCPVGFERVGSPVSVCKDTGDWSLPVPRCIPDCPGIAAPAHGAMSVPSSTKYGSVVRFECERGFSLVGASVVSCEGGRWNRPVPACFADCEAGNVPANSESRGGSSHGDVMTFKCVPGFQRRGPSMVTCQDGAWSGDFPTCVTV